MKILILIDAWFPFIGGAQKEIQSLQKILEKEEKIVQEVPKRIVKEIQTIKLEEIKIQKDILDRDKNEDVNIKNDNLAIMELMKRIINQNEKMNNDILDDDNINQLDNIDQLDIEKSLKYVEKKVEKIKIQRISD